MRRTVLSLIALSAACNKAHKVLPGDIDVTWRGAERGRFIAPLVASHCPQTGQVELLAIRGDTGVGIALFMLDSATVQPIDYPVVPGSQLDEPRPGASMGARWFATTSIASFEGVTGKVNLSTTGKALTGTLEVKFQALDRPDTLRMTGGFSQVPLQRADSNCRLIRKRHKL